MFALGLREEQLAMRAGAKEEAIRLKIAQTAYQRATWLSSTHAHAFTGLASISHTQGARVRTTKHLVKAEDAKQLVYAKTISRKVSYMLSVEGQPYEVGAGVYNDTATVEDLNALLKQ